MRMLSSTHTVIPLLGVSTCDPRADFMRPDGTLAIRVDNVRTLSKVNADASIASAYSMNSLPFSFDDDEDF